MQVTFSKLDTYKVCPLRFRLRYQEKLPEVPRRSRNLSLILHKTLQAFLRNARRDASLATLLRTYEAYCPAPADPKQAQRYSEGQRALEAFHWREGGLLPKAVALEQEFSTYMAGVKITGRLDCALETEAGLELIDFKFTQEIPESLDPLQLQIYALGLKEITGSAADTLTYYYLRQEKTIPFPGGEAAIEEAKEKITRLAQQIQEDCDFSPRAGAWCRTCSYHRYCPSKREIPDLAPQRLPSSQSGIQARLPI